MPQGMPYQTYQGWRNAIKKIDPDAKFEGNKDIANAFGKGILDAHWDGDSGNVTMKTSSSLTNKQQKAIKKAARFMENKSIGSVQLLMDETKTGWRLRYGSIGGSLKPLASGLRKGEAEDMLSELREAVEKPNRMSPLRSIVEIPKGAKGGSRISQRMLDTYRS